MDDIPLSSYGRASAEPAPVSRMMAEFAADFRDDVDINLGVGYVNERTIPRARILEAMEAVLARPDKHRAALNYGGPAGSPNLIDSLRRFYAKRGVPGLTEDTLRRREILIGPNGATSLLEGLARVVEPGIVVTSDPYYYIYCHYLERAGFEVLAVPEDDEGFDVDAAEARLAELGERKRHVRFFYVVTISNPTCTILSNARRRGVLELARRVSEDVGRRVPVIYDMAYEHLVHDPAVPPLESASAYDDAGLAYEIGTLSKILAPALRIGYLIGPPGALTRALVQNTSDVGFSAPLINQEIASFLLDHHVAEQAENVCVGYREKALQTQHWIDERLGPYLAERRGGQAGFYFYLTFREVETHQESAFFRFLSRTTGDQALDGPADARKPRVVYLPGEFCVHPRGELVEVGRRQLRLSYGFEEPSRIDRAIRLMRDAAEYALRRR